MPVCVFDFLNARLLSQNIQIRLSAFEFPFTNYFGESALEYLECYFEDF